jgi:hypothetical protein
VVLGSSTVLFYALEFCLASKILTWQFSKWELLIVNQQNGLYLILVLCDIIML